MAKNGVVVEQVISGMPTWTTNGMQYGACCDCGLVHLFVLQRCGKEFVITAYRDDYLTKVNRKRRVKK